MKKALLFVVLLTFLASLYSQNKTGSGNLTSNTGLIIPNALVHISPVSNTDLVFEYVCDKNGNYTFNLESDDSVFVFKFSASQQTLQFVAKEENIVLADGENEILFHQVQLTNNKGIQFTVVDTDGSPLADAEVILYDTKRKWRIDSSRIAKAVFTDVNGQVEINSLLPIEYWFTIQKGYLSNKFTLKNTDTIIDTTSLTTIAVSIRDLSQNEFNMCGICDDKTWITDSIVIFGISQPYDADSKLMSDGTWYDSNGNHGFWWFNEDESKMTYDYDSTSSNGGGSTVEATLIELTDSSFVGDMTMIGLPVTYYMSADYDTINLSLSVQDTTLFLDSDGFASLTPDDLIVETAYCFTCTTRMSQTEFDVNDIGSVEVVVTLEDRCGNQAFDTIFVTVIQGITAVHEIEMSPLSFYPNPVSDFLIIENKDENIESIDLIDVSGRLIKHYLVNNKQFTIKTSGLESGIYFVRVATAAGDVVKKIVIE